MLYFWPFYALIPSGWCCFFGIKEIFQTVLLVNNSLLIILLLVNIPYLSILIVLPLLAALVVLFIPQTLKNSYRWITLLAALVQLWVASMLYWGFEAATTAPSELSAYKWVERYQWLAFGGEGSGLRIDYFVGVDGLSISMIWLTALVMAVGALASWHIQEKARGYFALYGLLSAAIMGCFVALDFFLFYIFFEFMLLPMYFLIGLWGGVGREYASIKFFIYTLVGSLFILVGMIALCTSVQENGVYTFNLLAMMNPNNFAPDALLNVDNQTIIAGLPIRHWIFWSLVVGFLIKLPAVPLHTWLPDAHVEAPTAISVVLAGVLLKVGGYGLLRIAYSIFPDVAAHYAWWLAALGVFSIIYGALNALAMHDLKKLIAYSSVSHMGFVLLGIASLTQEGINGAVYQMFSHGIISAMLFLIVGVLYDRTHDRRIENYAGLASAMPRYTFFTAVAFFASLGLPMFSGFIAEALALLGAFKSVHLSRGMAVISTLGIVLAAAYYLWAFRRMFLGKFWVRGGDAWAAFLVDLTPREILLLLPLALLTFLFGVYPALLLDKISPTITALVQMIK